MSTSATRDDCEALKANAGVREVVVVQPDQRAERPRSALARIAPKTRPFDQRIRSLLPPFVRDMWLIL